MDKSLNRALVHTILEHAPDYPWRVQDIGLLGLRLDERREFRLHVWDPTSCRRGTPRSRPPLRLHVHHHRRRDD
jgi:hypothetical protein